MNMQTALTSVEALKSGLMMQARMEEAEAQRLAALAREPATPRPALYRDLAHAILCLEHQARLLVSELGLELGDVLHGHVPHRHRHAH